jgi:hypothetical protein
LDWGTACAGPWEAGGHRSDLATVLARVPRQEDLLNEFRVSKTLAPIDQACLCETFAVTVPIALLELGLQVLATLDTKQFIPL